MKNLSIIFFAVIAITLTSCKDNSKQESEPEVVTVENTASVDKTYEIAEMEAEFNDPKIEAAFEQYLKVEAALINTDAEKVTAEAAKLKTLIIELEADDATQMAVTSMADSNDINEQREHFEDLSAGVETMLQGALKSGTIYKQYCPMAFNNKGASWLSTSRDILNPYFGDKMLKCGRVDAEIR